MAETVRVDGLKGVLEMLHALPTEVASKNGGPARAALRKGTMVIVKQARLNFAAAVALAGLTGVTDTTGFTAKNIVAKRRRPPSGVKGEKFVVTVAGKTHPNGNKFKNKPLVANDVAFMMEIGTEKQPATPWLRPAFHAKAEAAIRVVESDLPKQIERIAARLARQKGV